MNPATPQTPNDRSRSNGMIAAAAAAVVFGMIGMAYAAVPLYQLFCQVTGYGGTTQRADTYADRVLDRTIKIRFDANTAGIPWVFRPAQREVEIRIGETKQISYTSRNSSDRAMTGTATFNVNPQLAGVYFNKIECFCFTETTLQPGETLDMPVVFFVDPDIVDDKDLKDITTITLSYTMFPVVEKEQPVASAPVDTKIQTNSTNK